jgi:C-terminal processing protease CtpA/Prc
MNKGWLTFILLLCLNATGQSLTSKEYHEDFDYFWTTIRDNYAYFDKTQTDWEKVRTMFGPASDTITSRRSFVLFLEKVFYELYDHHASLNTNTAESQRLVPSGTDIWAEFINGKAVIIELRRDYGAERCGLKAGMEIIAFDDAPIATAIQPFLPKSLKKEEAEAKNYALRVLLAGQHLDSRKITVKTDKGSKDFFPDKPENLLEKHQETGDIESGHLSGQIGYIRINNSLWDNNLIPLFDSVLNTMMNTKGLILDLRETPSGGNTTVVRSIIGHFISKEGFFQKHELVSEQMESGIKRSWVEIVSPKAPQYAKPLVILVDHWTGSVGEGMTIGFDALKRATIIGTRMAGLKGAVYSFKLPNSGIGFSFPAEKLFHVNGSPRENFKPTIPVDVKNQKGEEDLMLQKALKYLNRK